jgi:hypothetical protein
MSNGTTTTTNLSCFIKDNAGDIIFFMGSLLIIVSYATFGYFIGQATAEGHHLERFLMVGRTDQERGQFIRWKWEERHGRKTLESVESGNVGNPSASCAPEAKSATAPSL